jgi:hypothetical protein
MQRQRHRWGSGVSTRPSNSQECAYGGYKLSAIEPEIEIRASTEVDVLSAGCEDDDTFYEDAGKSGRVQLQVGTALDTVSIDLEDVLVFARKYCSGIYERVLREIEPQK